MVAGGNIGFDVVRREAYTELIVLDLFYGPTRNSLFLISFTHPIFIFLFLLESDFLPAPKPRTNIIIKHTGTDCFLSIHTKNTRA